MVWQRKVIWAEGMFLRPQHFQQQERFLFRQLQSRSLPGQPFFWGFSELELDTDLLRMGKLGIRSAHGVLPDGTPCAERMPLSLIHISEPTRPLYSPYAVFCLKKKVPADYCHWSHHYRFS